MKHSGTTLIFVIVWAAVLFASLVIGICIREVRFQLAKVESTVNIEPDVSSEVQMPDATEQLVSELAKREPLLGPRGAEGPRNFSSERRVGARGERGNMRERFANMSDEERAQMRERFSGRRRGGGQRFQNLSEEERAKMEEERRLMRERMENMSEEERAKMREETEKLREQWEEMSEEEREKATAQMQEKYGFAPRIGQGSRPGGGEGGRRQENN